jgi:hypothetical protein
VARFHRMITNGYLREGDQQMVDHLDPRYGPIVYDVAIRPRADPAVGESPQAIGFGAAATISRMVRWYRCPVSPCATGGVRTVGHIR